MFPPCHLLLTADLSCGIGNLFANGTQTLSSERLLVESEILQVGYSSNIVFGDAHIVNKEMWHSGRSLVGSGIA